MSMEEIQVPDNAFYPKNVERWQALDFWDEKETDVVRASDYDKLLEMYSDALIDSDANYEQGIKKGMKLRDAE